MKNFTQQAIERAVEGGWKQEKFRTVWHHWIGDSGIENIPVNSVLLDPLFWQALGKAGGWGGSGFVINKEVKLWIRCNQKEITLEEFKELIHVSFDVFHKAHKGEIKKAILEMRRRNKIKNRRVWKIHWHSFIDHLASGKDTESFFKDLLENKQ